MQQDIIELKGTGTVNNQLTARLVNGRVDISGDKSRIKLPKKSGSHKFKFKLDDETGLNVKFSAFGAQIGTTCPSGPGDNTGQIEDVEIDGDKAEFTDRNDGPEVTFAYAWFFTCDDASQSPTFDPIIDNGGTN